MGNFHQLYYHVIWATKERQSLIGEEFRQPLYDYLKGKAISLGGIVTAIGGVRDHIHICLSIPPQVSLAYFIGQLKGASAHWVNHIAMTGCSFGWQDGYGVFTVSKDNVNKIKAYIENQERHHREFTVDNEWEIE